MKTYEIEDYSGNKPITLLEDGAIIDAENGRKALDIYLKKCGLTCKVKVSADNMVHFKVQPIVIENGRKYLDRRNGQRALWYKITNN